MRPGTVSTAPTTPALDHLPEPGAEHDISTRYGTTRVYRFGDGPGHPLVLLPGNGATTTLSLPNVPPWSQRHSVFAVEPLGDAGRSTPDRPIRTVEEQAAWLADTLNGLGTGPAHLVGVSHGAWLAANLAVHDSRRLASLTLIEPAHASFVSVSLPGRSRGRGRRRPVAVPVAGWSERSSCR
jgi:pimeloyl-ACP methyl ester carboxylesterase